MIINSFNLLIEIVQVIYMRETLNDNFWLLSKDIKIMDLVHVGWQYRQDRFVL